MPLPRALAAAGALWLALLIDHHPATSSSLVVAAAEAEAAGEGTSTPAPRSALGVNWGAGFMRHPLPAREAFALLGAKGVYRIKLFDHDLETVRAIHEAIPGAEVTLGIGNDELAALAADAAAAEALLRPFQPFDAIVKYVAVTSEPNEAPAWKDHPKQLGQLLVPALNHTVQALRSLGMRAAVTVPFTMSLLAPWQPRPSRGAFRPAWNTTLASVLRLLDEARGVFMVNAHPYGAWKDAAGRVSLGYAIDDPTSADATVVEDEDEGGGGDRLVYRSLLDAMHDATLAALARAGYPDMPLVIGETGWPTAGGKGASPGHACRYIDSVGRRAAAAAAAVDAAAATPPRRPGPVEVYVLEAFDEDGKEDVWGGIEGHWGLLTERGEEKYPVNWLWDNATAPAACTPLGATPVGATKGEKPPRLRG